MKLAQVPPFSRGKPMSLPKHFGSNERCDLSSAEGVSLPVKTSISIAFKQKFSILDLRTYALARFPGNISFRRAVLKYQRQLKSACHKKEFWASRICFYVSMCLIPITLYPVKCQYLANWQENRPL